MASKAPVLGKGVSLPPTLLTPPLESPSRWQGKKLNKHLSYFDITAAPSILVNDKEEAMGKQGLGINFYGEGEEKIVIGDGNSSLSVAASEGDNKDEAESLGGASIHCGGDAEAQPQFLNHAPQLDNETPTFNNQPFQIPDEPAEELIEKLLEENYRGQAETFVRNSSQGSYFDSASAYLLSFCYERTALSIRRSNRLNE